MKRGSLILLGLAFLLASLVTLSCARIYPPATPAVGPAPTRVLQPYVAPHGVSEQTDCLACHSTDAKFLAALATSHPVPVPPGFQGSVHDACMLCHTIEPGHAAAKPLAHPVEGMSNCLTCHGSGTPGISQIPSDHRAYSADKCTVCHVPASSTASAATAKAIPHGLAGMENCVGCHGAGLPGISPMPADHAGRANQTCTACHAPK